MRSLSAIGLAAIAVLGFAYGMGMAGTIPADTVDGIANRLFSEKGGKMVALSRHNGKDVYFIKSTLPLFKGDRDYTLTRELTILAKGYLYEYIKKQHERPLDHMQISGWQHGRLHKSKNAQTASLISYVDKSSVVPVVASPNQVSRRKNDGEEVIGPQQALSSEELAIRAFEKKIREAPEVSAPYKSLAEIYLFNGDLEKSNAFYDLYMEKKFNEL